MIGVRNKINKFMDLHLHLDGAITVDIAKKLAALQNIELPTNDDKELETLLTVKKDCRNLDDFLKCFALPISLLQTREGIREAIKLVADNIFLAFSNESLYNHMQLVGLGTNFFNMSCIMLLTVRLPKELIWDFTK